MNDRSTRALLAACLLAGACGRGDGDARLDRASLRARLTADERVVELLGEASVLVSRGKAKEALALVDEKVTPLAVENATRAKELSLKTAWGREKGDATRALTEERRASVTSYREALASDDVERVVAAMEAEKPLDRRALDLTTAVDSPPPDQGCR